MNSNNRYFIQVFDIIYFNDRKLGVIDGNDIILTSDGEEFYSSIKAAYLDKNLLFGDN